LFENALWRGRRRRTLVSVLAALCVGLGLASCGSTSSTSGPVLTVVTGLWPLAQAAKAIGGRGVQVTDVVPAGTNPMAWRPSPSATKTIDSADVVLEVGAGFQPGFERAAKANAHTMYLDGPLKIVDPYLWLSPYRMVRVARLISYELAMVNPDGASAYHNGLVAFEARLAAVGQEYKAAFAKCASPLLVMEDGTFLVLRPNVHVRITKLDPALRAWPTARPGPNKASPAVLAHQAQVIDVAHARAIFNETWAPASYLTAASRATGARILTLDSLVGVPGGPAASTYLGRLKANLELMEKGVRC
jgi:zinc transport system substrate-binding protein